MGDFECDACDEEITREKMAWILKPDAPIHYNGEAFCFCEKCYFKYKSIEKGKIIKLESGDTDLYVMTALNIFNCQAHSQEKVQENTKCKCRCVICDKNNKFHRYDKWSISKLHVFHLNFSFLLCPDCQPKCDTDSGDGWYTDKIPFQKWLLPHLKFSLMRLEDYN